ncbi:hypothetical protein KUTeg_015443 [Tegillarca granosa]|uniref:Spondin-like TSP1 domain-containing protein n=1 Tax=Tegillarca granosa TaxID=220873 RepID=A0ABQ9EQ59_TEGGR|nr:hypothetical protein KUTeg_015443 [Tegillarca granosa]
MSKDKKEESTNSPEEEEIKNQPLFILLVVKSEILSIYHSAEDTNFIQPVAVQGLSHGCLILASHSCLILAVHVKSHSCLILAIHVKEPWLFEISCTCLRFMSHSYLILAVHVKGSWTECQLFGCGEGGTQVRPVWCERITATSSSVTQDGNCKDLQKPDEQRTCFKVCSEHRYQVKWATTSWSDCSLSPMSTVCARGSGVRYRNVTCVWKGNGQLEEDNVCSSFEQKPASRQRCELRCPQDCVVSVFSKWNSCESCRYANKTRTRNIIVPPSNGGKECPDFTESVPCRNCTSAYFLSIFPWSKCVSFSSSSSHPQVGHQDRDIKCINGLGARVNYRYTVKCLIFVPGSLPCESQSKPTKMIKV